GRDVGRGGGGRRARAGRAGERRPRLALHAQGDEEGRDLGDARPSAEDIIHRGGHLRLVEILVLDHAGDRVAQRHDRSGRPGGDGSRVRKFARIRFPSSVRIDSGWNWTPSTKSVRWRTPMISSSAVHAARSRTGGSAFGSITSE